MAYFWASTWKWRTNVAWSWRSSKHNMRNWTCKHPMLAHVDPACTPISKHWGLHTQNCLGLWHRNLISTYRCHLTSLGEQPTSFRKVSLTRAMLAGRGGWPTTMVQQPVKAGQRQQLQACTGLNRTHLYCNYTYHYWASWSMALSMSLPIRCLRLPASSRVILNLGCTATVKTHWSHVHEFTDFQNIPTLHWQSACNNCKNISLRILRVMCG